MIVGTLGTPNSGTLTINSTNNSYTGGTVVNSGTLYLGPGGSLATAFSYSNVGMGMVTVNAGGTLVGDGYGHGNGVQHLRGRFDHQRRRRDCRCHLVGPRLNTSAPPADRTN